MRRGCPEQGYLLRNVGRRGRPEQLGSVGMRLTAHTSPTLLHTSDRSVTATRLPATTSNSGSRSTSLPPSRTTCWPGPLALVAAAAACRPPSLPSLRHRACSGWAGGNTGEGGKPSSCGGQQCADYPPCHFLAFLQTPRGAGRRSSRKNGLGQLNHGNPHRKSLYPHPLCDAAGPSLSG